MFVDAKQDRKQDITEPEVRLDSINVGMVDCAQNPEDVFDFQSLTWQLKEQVCAIPDIFLYVELISPWHVVVLVADGVSVKLPPTAVAYALKHKSLLVIMDSQVS
nr:hypothetical protein [Leptospira meyeri]